MTERALEVAIIHQCAETRNTLHAAVSQLGHKVCYFADNGREFVERARARRPDLAIVQRRLPDMDGLQAVHDAGGAIPAILVIAPADPGLPTGAAIDGVQGILQTPVRTPDVLPAIALATQQMSRLEALRTGIKQLATTVDDAGNQVFPPPPTERNSSEIL